MSIHAPALPVPLLPLLTMLCGQLLMVGSFAPWGTAQGFEMLGIEGDGALTQVLGVYTSIMGLLHTAQVVPKRPVLWMLLAVFAVAVGVTLLDVIDFDGRIGGAPPGANVSMAWGLVVTFVGAVAGCVVTIVQLRRLYQP